MSQVHMQSVALDFVMGYGRTHYEEAAGPHPANVWEDVRLTATTTAALSEAIEPAPMRRLGVPLWVGFLLLLLTFLVIYPLLMLLFGALSDSNPVVDGF